MLKTLAMIQFCSALFLPAIAAKKDFELPPQLAIGSPAPEFTLVNAIDGKSISIAEYRDKVNGVCVVFFCNHCPVAKAYENRVLALGRKYISKGIAFLMIMPNDTTTYPMDGPEGMRRRAKEKNYPFPYLFDADQTVSLAFGARVTPHIYLFDKDLILRYLGAVDDNQYDPDAVGSTYLANALERLLAGKVEDIDPATTTAVGCTIKWK